MFSEQVRAYILYARNKDLEQTKQLLLKALSKDTTRLDVMQEVAKIHYFMRDYRNAFTYYQLFSETKEALNLDIYGGENAKIAVVLSKLGKEAESERYFEKFKEFAENDESIYHHISLAVYHSYQGDTKNAIEQLRLFSKEDNYPYWITLVPGDRSVSRQYQRTSGIPENSQ